MPSGMFQAMTTAVDFPETLLNDEQRQVWQLREQEKLSVQEVAQRQGVLVSKVYKLWNAADERVQDYQRNGNKAISLLPGRVRNALVLNDLADWDVVRDAITSGRLKWRGTNVGGGIMMGPTHIKNLRWGYWVALHDWVGLPHPVPVLPTKRGGRKKAQPNLVSPPQQNETGD